MHVATKPSDPAVQLQPSSCLTPRSFTTLTIALRTLERRRHYAHFMGKYTEAKMNYDASPKDSYEADGRTRAEPKSETF